MNNVFRKIRNSKWNGLLSLGMGTILSQGINLLIQPILTRLISPEELGIYSYIYSIANLFIPIASLKLYLLIVTAEEDDEANDIIKISVISVLLVSILYILIIMLSAFFTDYSSKEFILLFLMNPILIFIFGLYYIFLSEDNRYKKYNNMAKAEVTTVATMGVIQLLSGFFNIGSLGLLLGRIFSPIYYFKKSVLYVRKNINIKNIKLFFIKIKKYRDHIIYSVPSQFINSFSYTMIMLSIVTLFTSEEVGYYSVSVKVLGIPLILISNNLSKVYLQKISDVKRHGNSLYFIFKDTVKKLSIISFSIFSLLAFIAPFITEFIFGLGYAEAGRYITILCVMFSFRFIALSLNGTYVVVKKQHLEMTFQIILIIVGGLAFLLASIYDMNIYMYLMLISVAYSLVYFMMIMNIGRECAKNDHKV